MGDIVGGEVEYEPAELWGAERGAYPLAPPTLPLDSVVDAWKICGECGDPGPKDALWSLGEEYPKG